MKKALSMLIACFIVVTLSSLTVLADTVLYENTFDSADLLDSDWSYGHLGAQSANKIKDGKLFIGSDSGNWVSDLVDANYNSVFTNAVYEFDYSASKNDCYSGFGLRLPTDVKPDLFGGGRAGVAENDIGYGISVDMFSAPNADKIVIAFNDGAMQDSPYVALDIPDGFDVTQTNRIKVKDSGSRIEISLNGALFAALNLSGLSDGYYTAVEILKADGSAAAAYDDVPVLEEGAIGFYQRNNNSYVDNLTISSIPEGGEDPGTDVPGTPSQGTPTPGAPQEQPGTGDLGAGIIILAVLVLGSVWVILRKRSAV